MSYPKKVAAFAIGIACVLGFTAIAGAQTLTLEEYQQQVLSIHKGAKAAQTAQEAAELKAKEAQLMTQPYAFGQAQWLNDKKPTANPGLQGDRTQVESATVGIGQKWANGLDAKISYSLNRIDLHGANPMFIPEDGFYEAAPKAEVNYPLMKNQGGTEIIASQHMAETQAKVSKYSEDQKLLMIKTQAETAYWRLAVLQEMLKVQETTLQRAKKIRDWSQRRTNLSLSDRSDLLQSEAAVKYRELELLSAKDQLLKAKRDFNTLRGKNDDSVTELMPTPSSAQLAKAAVDGQAKTRPAVEAAKEATKLAAYNTSLQEQKYKPQLDVFASLAMNGRDEDLGATHSDVVSGAYPTAIVGVKLNMMLGDEYINAQRAAAVKDQNAAELNAAQLAFDEQQQFIDLQARLNKVQEKLDLARQIEAAQKTKVTYERERHQKGRTVTFQVLQFEQDYSQAQMNRLNIELEALMLLSQIKTYY